MKQLPRSPEARDQARLDLMRDVMSLVRGRVVGGMVQDDAMCALDVAWEVLDREMRGNQIRAARAGQKIKAGPPAVSEAVSFFRSNLKGTR